MVIPLTVYGRMAYLMVRVLRNIQMDLFMMVILKMVQYFCCEFFSIYFRGRIYYQAHCTIGCGFIFRNGNFIMAMRFFTVYIHANVKNIFWNIFRGRLPTGDGRFKIQKQPTVKKSTLSDCSDFFPLYGIDLRKISKNQKAGRWLFEVWVCSSL